MNLNLGDVVRRCSAIQRAIGLGPMRSVLAWRGRSVRASATLHDHGDYMSGDDYRYVDWNHCARHDELLSRYNRGKEECVVRLLIDDSPRMGLGQRERVVESDVDMVPGKFDLARQAALGIACLSLQCHARVGACTISTSASVPPARSVRHLGQLARLLSSVNPSRNVDDLAKVAHLAERWQSSHVFILSDLLHYRGMLSLVDHFRRCGHVPVVIQVRDEGSGAGCRPAHNAGRH